jgi:hypothetical protein
MSSPFDEIFYEIIGNATAYRDLLALHTFCIHMLDFSTASFHPYITARDHERTFVNSRSHLVAHQIVESAASALRELIEIPAHLAVTLFNSGEVVPQGTDASWKLPNEAIDWTNTDRAWASTWRGLGVPGRAVVQVAPSSEVHVHPTTPEIVKAAYLMSMICRDLQRRGVSVIRREARYKKAVLQHALQAHPLIGKDSVDPESVISLIRFTPALPGLPAFLRARGIVVSQSANRIEVCNFPSHSKEQFEALADSITAWNAGG